LKQIIHVFGASGSGTTTLGKAIGKRLSCRALDSDDFFWLPTNPPYTTRRPADERVALIREEFAKDGDAVLSGSLVDWGDSLIPLFTLAVRLVTPTDERIRRIKEREHARFGSRIDDGGDMHAAHEAFLRWASAYDDGPVTIRSRAEHDRWQTKLTCRLLTLDGTRPVDELVDEVERALAEGEHDKRRQL